MLAATAHNLRRARCRAKITCLMVSLLGLEAHIYVTLLPGDLEIICIDVREFTQVAPELEYARQY